ncbi:unnamed protein product [Chilo suppressalis]|uniref:Uncharacterized protein n=1 Tax=Chilo suppressalis TaxID=168631 RepID=A0ABN8B1B3_CHISP|nr:unnamed protein product [Chilo suppressalis]
MLTKWLIIILIFMIVAVASFDRNINVGTTLFSRADLNKVDWSAIEFGLLKARRYFQDLLPSGSFIDTANEAYVNKLFKYFKDTYSTIKRQTPNETANQVMTIAFSDAVGGYVKFWALPVTKRGFYGGTVSQNNIMKLSQLYNELKNFLETDGDEWRSPNKNLLRDTTFNVAPPQHVRRSMKDPCKELVLEESPFGLIIPVPNVHWEDRSNTMFVPFKKQSIIPLESPDYPNALVQYYDIAKNCIEENKPDAINDFEERFQTWLTKEVMPHLCDENIYLALGSVLTLVNKTRDLGRKCYHAMNSKIVIAGFPIDFSSKKTLFILIILILEIVWCIPALIYLACSRKSKKRNFEVSDCLCSTDSTDDTHANNTTNKTFNNFIKGLRKKKRCFKYTEDSSSFQRGFKLEQKPRADIVNFESASSPPELKSSVTSKAAVSFEREAKNVSLKSSMKKIYSSHTSRSQYNVSVKPGKSKLSLTNSKVCVCSKCTIYDSLHNSDSSVVVKNPVESNDHSVVETSSEVTNVISKSDTYTVKLDKSNSTSDKLSCKKALQDLDKAFPCYACLNNESESQITILNENRSLAEFDFEKSLDANTQVHLPLAKENVSENLGLKIDSGQPCLEIMIEKPNTEISVGIKGIFDNKPTVEKPSKIPKRVPQTLTLQLTCQSSKKQENRLASTNKSLIPQRKKPPVDDMVIQDKKTTHKDKNKLNETL